MKYSLTPGRSRVLALIVADALSVVAIWAIIVGGYVAIAGIKTYSPVHYFQLWPVILVFIGINMVCRLYHGSWMYPAMPLSPVEEFRRLFASAIFTHILLMAFLGFSRQNLEYSRLIIGGSGLLVGLLAQSFRNLVRRALYKLRLGQIPVALAGSGKTAQQVAKIIRNNCYIGFDIVLTFDDDHLRDIVPVSRAHDVKLLIACQDERQFRVQLRDFASWFSYIEYLPSAEVFPVLGSHSVVLDGIGGLEMKNQGRMKALRWEKRIFDLILATLGFLLALPVFLIFPLIIKLTSPGPVFYRARRLGKNGVPFDVFKFRSMNQDAADRLPEILAANPQLAVEYRHNFKLRNDPRVTSFGKFLRKTSLDELPQLFNVFRGEMSLIGPRPIVEAEIPEYGDDYEVLRRVRPGITGLWQCMGRSDVDYAQRVALDTYYILNWSAWMDVWICIRTFYAMLLMKGAC